MSPKLDLISLGTLDIRLDGKSASNLRSNKAQALLCYLVVTGRAHSRTALSGLLWGDTPDEQARASLRQALSNLTEFSIQCFIVTRQSIAFDPNYRYSLDTERFEAAAARLVVKPGEVELHADLDLYGGDFLDGFFVRNAPDFENWMLGIRARYREMALQAFNAVATYWMEQGNWAQAIFYSRRLLEIEPLHEGAHRLLIQLFAQTGQRTAALEQYRRCQQVLTDELGVEPDETTQSLYNDIKSNRWVATSPAHPVTPSAAPLDDLAVTRPPSNLSTQNVSLPAFLVEEDALVAPLSSFVGRRRELAALAAAWQKTQAGQGQLRFVTGGAGQGKSTLVQEFIRQEQAENQGLLVITGYCNAYTGSGDPYLPFREALALLAGEVENQGAAGKMPVENARRLWSALPNTLPTLVEYAPDLIGSFVRAQSLLERAAGVVSSDTGWFKQLATLCANTQSMPLDERQIFSQYTAAFQAIAKKHPLLLILEDLHWMDVASSSMLFHLSRTLSNSRILVIGTYRPAELAAPKTPAGREEHSLATMMGEFKRQHGAIWLDLDALTASEGRDFVEEYVDTQPNQLDVAFRSALFQHTGGHALFTVELLHEMQERGDLRQDKDGRWVTSQQLEWHALPAKVEGVIERQMARLDNTTQAILRVACVQGESLTAEVIAKVLQLNEQAVVQKLSQELSRQQRLVSAQELTWVGGQRLSHYRFRHYLFQRYLYQSLDEMERTYLHEAVGNALESLYGEQVTQIAVELAYHSQQAGRFEKAVALLLVAGQRAQKLAAHKGAIQHLTQALELLQMLPQTTARDAKELDCLIALGQVMDIAGNLDHGEIEKVYQRARLLCNKLGENGKLWPILYGLAMTHFYRGQYLQASRYTEEMLQFSLNEGDLELRMIANALSGSDAITFGKFMDSIPYIEQGLTLHKAIEQRGLEFRHTTYDIKIEMLNTVSLAKWFTGFPDQARRYNETALQIATAWGQPFIVVQGVILMTWQLELRREFAKTRIYAERLIRLATEHDLHLFLNHAYIYDGSAMSELGEAEAGLARLLEGVTKLRASGNMMANCHFAHLLARGCAAVGQLERGIKVIDAALTTVEQSGEHWFDAELRRLKGELLLLQDAPVEVVEGYFDEAIVIARRQQAKIWELRATVSLCKLWQGQGKAAAAHARLAELYDWFTEGFSTPDLLEAKTLLEELA